MSAPLLNTKLYIPHARSELVPRPHLIEKLNTSPLRKLTLISAPAGFGKTTILCEWIASNDYATAWVSLDESDNSPTRFWSYVIAALQTIQPNVGEEIISALHSPQPPPIEQLLTSLINEIAREAEPTIVALDDYHVIVDQQVNDALAFLLTNAPPHLHLALATRSNPPWPLARMRARHQINELRADDLRFTTTEAAAFLNDVMGLDLSTEAVSALETRTEGWIVGLQMAALSMQERADVDAFVNAFSGSHRLVLDYLVEEVLDQQPTEIQDFLIRTSILDRLTASLCEAVMESGNQKPEAGRQKSDEEDWTSHSDFRSWASDSQSLLEHLESSNLFLIPLDDERRWYRYHHLFADLLHKRLMQTKKIKVPELHSRASEWYEQNGLIVEAARHALTAGDFERVAHLAENNALAMMDRGELTTLAGWLSALPDELVHTRPWLWIAQAWPLAYAGQRETVEILLQRAQDALNSMGESTRASTEGQRVTGHIAAIRAHVLGLQGRASEAAEIAHTALELLPEGDSVARAWAAYYAGFMLRIAGELEPSAQAFAKAVDICSVAGDTHISILTLTELATLQFLQGQLRKAAATCQDAIKIGSTAAMRGGQPLPVTGFARTRLSGVLREWNELEDALLHASEGLELCRKWGQADALLEGHIHLAQVLQAIGDAAGAQASMEEARLLAQKTSPWFVGHADAHQAKLWLAQGKLGPASDWADKSGIKISDEPDLQRLFRYQVLARLLITQGEHSEAKDLLTQLLQVAEAGGGMHSAIEILVLQAIAFQLSGDTAQALVSLGRSLSIAQPERYVRVFIDEGPAMGELLRHAISQRIEQQYASRLLITLGETATEDRLRAPPPSPLIEPLTEREQEILRFLSTSLTREEIAQELYVSVNTVKAHIRSIYSKLDVHRRMEAVERAKELGLL